MSGCCIVPTEHADLQPYVDALVPSTMTDLVNTLDVGGSLYRDGGVGGTNDAYGFTTNYVEGTGCAYWEYRQFFDDLTTNNLINVWLTSEDEEANLYGYGHSFNLFFGLQRVGWHHALIQDTTLYYGPILPCCTEVGYTVGFRFSIYYNNGNVWLDQNSQGATDTEQWEAISGGGQPWIVDNTKRWRLRVGVVPAEGALAHSPLISETIVAPSNICATGLWSLPPLEWTAEATVTEAPPVPSVGTFRFDSGIGSQYYLVPPVTDSGNELRSKTLKAMRATGKKTNVSMKAYGYDINDSIDTDALEAGTGSSTTAQSLPDSTEVTQSPRKPINVKNAVLSTVRLEGDDRGETTRDRIDEIVVEQAIQGVRR